jgi:hypothetical protein
LHGYENDNEWQDGGHDGGMDVFGLMRPRIFFKYRLGYVFARCGLDDYTVMYEVEEDEIIIHF